MSELNRIISDTDIKNFHDFQQIMSAQDNNKLKGDLFELFAQLFFKLNPSCRFLYKEFYPFNEIPNDLREYLNLPYIDKGIDGVIVDYNDNYYALQVKYRQDSHITYGEIATFSALLYGTNCRNFRKGVFFTNCNHICTELKNPEKYIIIDHNVLTERCDGIFWSSVREYLTTTEPTSFNLKLKPLPHQ